MANCKGQGAKGVRASWACLSYLPFWWDRQGVCHSANRRNPGGNGVFGGEGATLGVRWQYIRCSISDTSLGLYVRFRPEIQQNATGTDFGRGSDSVIVFSCYGVLGVEEKELQHHNTKTLKHAVLTREPLEAAPDPTTNNKQRTTDTPQ